MENRGIDAILDSAKCCHARTPPNTIDKLNTPIIPDPEYQPVFVLDVFP